MKDRIEKVLLTERTKKVWRNDKDSQEYRDANALYWELFGRKLKTGCGSCVEDLFYSLRHMPSDFNNQINSNQMSKFALKAGIMLALHGFDPVNNKNLTDEKALEILAKYPGHHVSFEVKPPNWKELVEEYKNNPPKKKKAEQTTGSQSDTGNDGGGSAADGGVSAEDKEKAAFLGEKTVKELKELLKDLPETEEKKKLVKKDEIIKYLIKNPVNS